MSIVSSDLSDLAGEDTFEVLSEMTGRELGELVCELSDELVALEALQLAALVALAELGGANAQGPAKPGHERGLDLV